MGDRDLLSNSGSEEDLQLRRVLTTLLWAIGGIYIFVISLALFYGDRALMAVMLAATALLSIPLALLGRHRLRASALAIVLIVLATLTSIATVGQGIRDMAVLGFPIIVIFAALVLDRALLRLCVGLGVLAICWLAVGETIGWFVTKPFEGGNTNWFYLIGVTLILLIAAFGVDLLASNIRRNLELAQTEIASRKGIEQKLVEEKILLRTLIDSLPDRIYAMDTKGTKILSNTADWRASGGKTMEDVVGKTDFDTYPHDLAAQFWALDKQVLDSGVPVIGAEAPGLDPEGQPVMTLTSKVPLRNAQGQIVGLVASGHDITARKRAEEALHQSNAQLRALFAAMRDVVLVIDVDGVYRNIAPTNPELLVEPPEELLGENLRNVFPHEQAEILISTMRQVLQTKQTAQIEYDLIIRDRTVRFETSIAPMTENSTLWVAHDITARKRVEEALAWEQYLLRTLLDNLPDRIYFKDRDSRFTRISKSQAEMFGLSDSAGALGKTDLDFFTEAHARPALEAEQKIMVTGQPLLGLEEQETWTDGRQTWVHTTKMPLRDNAGNIMGTFGISRDITQRKRLELVQNAILRITAAAMASDGIETLYRTIHSILTELIPTDNFYIALYDPANDLLSFPYFVDQYDAKPVGPTRVEGLTGYVINTGQPLLATREVVDRLVGQGRVQRVGPTGEDWMGAPLKAAGGTIGVVAMQSYQEGVHFSQADLDLLEFVSTQVAQVIERKRMEEEIRNLSLTDELTGLYNRRGFTILAEQETMLAARIKRKNVLLYCDLDNLKSINDAHGHAQGDMALKEVASVLKDTCRESDILARFGGDEFVVFAVDVPPESAVAVGQRIHHALEERNLRRHGSYALTLSMGMARFDPDAPRSVSELIAEADGLMYAAKQAKKAAKPG